MVWQGKKVEVKRRAAGFKELYGWLKILEGSSVATIKRDQDAPDMLFIRADNKPWLLIRALTPDEMRLLDADSV